MSNETIIEAVKAHKKDVTALPKVAVASIRPIANKGTLRDGEYKSSAFVLKVQIAEDWVDVNGRVHKGVHTENGRTVAGEWLLESEWVLLAGQKTTKRVYRDIDAAKTAKESIKATWGVKVEKAERSRAKGPSKAELEAELKRLRDELAAARAAA